MGYQVTYRQLARYEHSLVATVFMHVNAVQCKSNRVQISFQYKHIGHRRNRRPILSIEILRPKGIRFHVESKYYCINLRYTVF